MQFSRRRTKMGNKRVIVKGISFDSKLESHVYLKLLEFKRKYDFEYRLQPRYILLDKFKNEGVHHRAITYRADFEIKINGQVYTIDTKGFETQVFKIKQKMFAHKYKKEIVCPKSVREFVEWFYGVINYEEVKG